MRSLSIALLLLALAACSTDTPTAPERTPAPPPGSTPATAWSITVTVEPRDLEAGDAQPATVTVEVRRAADGSRPPNGTTVVVSAGLGEFITAGSGEQSVVVALSGGAAQLLYFAGAILGQDTIQAQLENSFGSARVNIVEPATLFLTGVRPSSGGQGGGTRIRISGTGFSEPARVELVGGRTSTTILATVDRVGKDAEGEFVRAITGRVIDPEGFFDVETCDTDGDGSEDGEMSVDTSVSVRVVFTDGSAELPGAFTYQPSDRSCRDVTPDPDRPRADFSFIVDEFRVQFFNESSPDTGLSFTWSFGDGTAFSNDENPVHNYANAGAGTYTVTLRVENSSGSDTKSRAVTVPVTP